MDDLGLEVRELDVEGFRPGSTHRLRLQIIEDGFGYPVQLPILVARGKRPGPTFGITAAVHGDEINGIPVIHKLFDLLEPNRLSGTVIAVLVVNHPGFARGQRRFVDAVDLNHIMPGLSTGNVSAVYAHRVVARVVRHFDYLVDLHTASRGRINSMYARVDLDDPVSAQMATLLRPQIIVHNPPNDGTLRGAATDLKIPAVTLEIGNPQRFQPEYITTAVRGLRSVMNLVGMLKVRPRAEGKEPITCRASSWIYTDRGGLLTVHPKLCERVEVGQPLATLTNIFGDVTSEYLVEHEGYIIGKSVNPVGHTGARIAHIGTLDVT